MENRERRSARVEALRAPLIHKPCADSWRASLESEAMQSNVPNLDCETADTCFSFWAKHQRGRASRDLFPDGGKQTRRATADLASYASNIGAAKQCRIRGDIPTALMYEGIAERIYQSLPAFARW